jgi:hypothetical protein
MRCVSHRLSEPAYGQWLVSRVSLVIKAVASDHDGRRVAHRSIAYQTRYAPQRNGVGAVCSRPGPSNENSSGVDVFLFDDIVDELALHGAVRVWQMCVEKVGQDQLRNASLS